MQINDYNKNQDGWYNSHHGSFFIKSFYLNGGILMSDWNKNGKYDMSDSYMDYHLANGSGSSGGSSDWWKWLLLAIVVGVCPPIGVIILIIVFIFG